MTSDWSTTSALRAQGLVPGADLSASAEKLAVYEADSYFRETWEDLASILDEPEAWAHRTALAVLKPDAVAGRRLRPTMQWLEQNGLTIVDARVVRFDRLLIRELWRYQFNLATRRRIDIVDILLPASGSLLLTMVDEDPSSDRSTSERLRALKGPADPRRRRPGELRTELRSPNTLLNFLHAADEPADVVRELGVFLDHEQRDEVITAAIGRRPRSPEQGIIDLEAEVPEHDLEFASSIRRIRAEVRGRSDRAAALCEQMADGSSDDWPSLLREIELCDVPVATWDFLTVATHLTESNLAGVEPLLDVPRSGGVTSEAS